VQAFRAAPLRNGAGTAAFFHREEDVAMDRLTKREQPDRSKINMDEAWEVKYWTHALGVSRQELQQAVDKVGNSAAAVRKELAV
jgi:Protein of unknown function (DUF3606)